MDFPLLEGLPQGVFYWLRCTSSELGVSLPPAQLCVQVVLWLWCQDLVCCALLCCVCTMCVVKLAVCTGDAAQSSCHVIGWQNV